MEEDNTLHMTALDAIAGENLQIIKAAVPYINITEQRLLSIIIKVIELENTISFFKETGDEMKSCSLSTDAGTPLEMMSDIRNYCNPPQLKIVDSFINFLSAFELFNTFSEVMSNENSDETDGSVNRMDLMKSLLPPEQQSMLDTFSAIMNT